MTRILWSELLPLVLAAGLISIGFLYTPIGIPMLVIVLVVYLLYRKLREVEYYYSEEVREALFWRDTHPVTTRGIKVLGLIVTIGLIYGNHRADDRWLDVAGHVAPLMERAIPAASGANPEENGSESVEEPQKQISPAGNGEPESKGTGPAEPNPGTTGRVVTGSGREGSTKKKLPFVVDKTESR